MKRALLFVCAVLFAGMLLSSCKTGENCPAYGKRSEASSARHI